MWMRLYLLLTNLRTLLLTNLSSYKLGALYLLLTNLSYDTLAATNNATAAGIASNLRARPERFRKG